MRLLSLVAVLALVPIAAGEDPHPLRFIPKEANLVVRIEKPRQLAESITTLDLVREMQTLPFVREQLQSPVYQRFQQLLAYYERDLGAKWPELLDRLAGHGITLAGKVGGDNAPVLIVIDGTDEALAEKFLGLAINLFEQELARQESKDKVERGDYRGIPSYKFGDFHFTRIGSALLLSNKKDALKLALDLHLDHGQGLSALPGPAAARKALPADCLAWLWLDLDVARKAPNAKDAFAQPSNDVIQTVLVGGWLDVVRRAPFLTAGLAREKDKFHLSVRLPGGGHDGQPTQMALHAPPAGMPGNVSLLEPKGVLLSHSFYFDFDVLYQQRNKLFNEKIAKDFENGEKQVKPFLLGNSLAKLASQAGPYHRVVVAHRGSSAYGVKPKQYYPSIAYINTMRDPAFAKPMEGILRGIALLGSGAFHPKLFEETHSGIKIIGYRFPEDREVADDPDNLRFNFSPCFAAVHNQFLVCSTIEFAREMVDLLQREFDSSHTTTGSAPFRLKVFGDGGADLLRGFEEQVLGQIVLDQAVKPEEGRRQMDSLLAWLRRLGTVEFRSEYADKEFRFDIEWRMKK